MLDYFKTNGPNSCAKLAIKNDDPTFKFSGKLLGILNQSLWDYQDN